MTRPKRKRRRRARIVRAPYLVELAKAGLIPAPREATRCLDALAAAALLTDRLGHAPSATQIGAELGVSRQMAMKLCRELEARGLMVDPPVVIRAGKWTLTPEGASLLQNGISSSPSNPAMFDGSGSGNEGAPSSSGWALEGDDRDDPFELEPWSKTSDATTSVR